MQFSRNWLSEYVDLPDTFEALAEGLTGAGLAVEGRTAVGDDIYFDLDVTSNRPDCMSHLGIAREVSAIFGVSVKPPECPTLESVQIDSNAWGSISIEDTGGCSRYVGVVVRGATVGASPRWLVERLEAVGVRSINNVVDVTNFVLWEYGQPLHAFDADKLRGARIIVRSARDGESLTTLDGEERELDSRTLVIADAEGPVALAGVMGGLDSEVTESSTNVLIESAYFEPARVRIGAKRLGLHTDASHRFERGADFEVCLEAALRAAALIRDLCDGELDPDAIDVRAGMMTEPLEGTFSLAELSAFSGVEIDKAFVVARLERLGFALQEVEGSKASWRVQVPSWRRHDFETDSEGSVYPAYFYEEVLRMLGLDEIPPTLPAIGGPDQGAGRSHRRREELRTFLVATGLAETITYSFGPAAADRRFENLAEGPALRVANALSEQHAFLRRSLLPNLVEGALFNLRREAQAVRLFEFGHVFPAAAPEVEALGIVLGGALGSPWRRGATLDLFDLKGILEELGRERGVSLVFEPREIAGFVAGTSAEVRRVSGANSHRVGYLGRVDEPESPAALYASEIEIEAFDRGAVEAVAVPSRHPGVAVDLTLTHSVETPWELIAGLIRRQRPGLLASFELIDRYRGEGVPEGAVNTTIAFRYSASDRSLTQDEVNEQHARITQELESRFRFGTSRG